MFRTNGMPRAQGEGETANSGREASLGYKVSSGTEREGGLGHAHDCRR